MGYDENVSEWLAAMFMAIDDSADEIWRIHMLLCSDQGMYLACWEKLDAPFRRHWKSYLEDYERDQLRECGASFVLPERFSDEIWPDERIHGVRRG